MRFAETFRPRFILIENVQGIRHDRMGSLAEAKQHLRRLDYSFKDGLVRAEQVGVPQTRRRYFLFATTQAARPFDGITSQNKECVRTIGWAIADLTVPAKSTVFDTASDHSDENKRRIDYLFDHDLYELPDKERPDCHRSGGHRYASVYGRMRWDRPAPTITTGFGSAGQGRFVHPKFRRTLTPHEAARIQFFPDFFRFGERGRRQYQELIGNAVPPKLAYAVVLHQLR
jgi:DNA (cytosine-5)-methyltransferase 1